MSLELWRRPRASGIRWCRRVPNTFFNNHPDNTSKTGCTGDLPARGLVCCSFSNTGRRAAGGPGKSEIASSRAPGRHECRRIERPGTGGQQVEGLLIESPISTGDGSCLPRLRRSRRSPDWSVDRSFRFRQSLYRPLSAARVGYAPCRRRAVSL